MPEGVTTVDLTYGGPGRPPQPWQVQGSGISYDGAVMLPLSVPGGNMGPGTINAMALYVQGVQFVNPANKYLLLTGGTLTGALGLLNIGSLLIPGGSAGQMLVTDGNSNLSWSSAPPGGPYLPLTGGALSGPLQITGPTNLVMGGGTPGQFLSTNGSGVLSWTTVTSGGGGASVTISDTAPVGPTTGNLWYDSVGGQLYIYYHDADSSQWVVTNNPSNPAQVFVSDTLPNAPNAGNFWFDSTAAQLYIYYNDGTSSQWVIANSLNSAALALYLPLAGGTLTGAVQQSVPPAAGDNSSAVPTTAWVDNAAPAVSHGYKNKFRNGGMDIWQRGQPISVANGSFGLTADGWYVFPTGAAVSVAIAGGTSPQWKTTNVLTIAAVSGLTNCYMMQRIESSIAASMGGTQVTFQCKVANSTGAAITPQLSTNYANSADTWTGATGDLGSTNLQTVPNDSATHVISYTFTPSVNAKNGYGVYLSFLGGLNGTTGGIFVSEFDIRITPGWPVGLCANPPPIELRPYPIELIYCCRYYQTYPGSTMIAGYGAAGAAALSSIQLKVQMRAAPTSTILGTPSYSNSSGFGIASANPTLINPACNITATGNYSVVFNVGLSAEI